MRLWQCDRLLHSTDAPPTWCFTVTIGRRIGTFKAAVFFCGNRGALDRHGLTWIAAVESAERRLLFLRSSTFFMPTLKVVLQSTCHLSGFSCLALALAFRYVSASVTSLLSRAMLEASARTHARSRSRIPRILLPAT